MAAPTLISDPHDPRLHPYRDLKERQLQAEGDRFVAESEMVVRKLLASPLEVESVLVTQPRWRALAHELEAHPGIPVYLAGQDTMDHIAGFHVHRGCLAIGRRPRTSAIPPSARLIVALEDLVDVDNVGAIVRHAAAFGANALLLSPRCADPFYRKAVRVAVGNTFFVPIVRARAWPDALVDLGCSHGATRIAAVIDEGATPLERIARDPRPRVLVFGSEGPGLARSTIEACDVHATIPMASADSLNVATACAVFLYHFTRGA